MIRTLLTFLILTSASLFSSDSQFDSKTAYYENYTNNSYISREEKDAIKKYLLPADHKVKPLLDAIFLSSRATENKTALLRAGFVILSDQPRSFIIVATHPHIPGYIFKLHLDDDKRKKGGKPGWHWFERRMFAIRQITKCIEDNHYTKYFKTPNKWAYPLPMNPSPPDNSHYERKNFILVEDDMELARDSKNVEFWKNEVSYKQLDQLKHILEVCGGSSIRPRNLPLCKDGRIAFIDTEYPGRSAKFYQLKPFLNHRMRAYWEKTTEKRK